MMRWPTLLGKKNVTELNSIIDKQELKDKIDAYLKSAERKLER